MPKEYLKLKNPTKAQFDRCRDHGWRQVGFMRDGETFRFEREKLAEDPNSIRITPRNVDLVTKFDPKDSVAVKKRDLYITMAVFVLLVIAILVLLV